MPGGTMSAALVLAHEMGHAAQNLKGMFAALIANEAIPRAECNTRIRRERDDILAGLEANNLKRFEIPIAEYLGEPMRRSYGRAIGMRRMRNSTHHRIITKGFFTTT